MFDFGNCDNPVEIYQEGRDSAFSAMLREIDRAEAGDNGSEFDAGFKAACDQIRKACVRLQQCG